MDASHRHQVVLSWSEADRSYFAQVPELPGCVADGPSYSEALAAVEVVMREWIETAKKLGRSVPAPREFRGLFA